MKLFFTLILLLILFSGCGGKKSSDAVNPVGPAPKAAVLSFPGQDAVCISGDVISATQSSVQFKWNNSENTDSYSIVTKNLLTGDSTTTQTSQTIISIILERNTPFSWYVISKSSKNTATAKSSIWRFYNAGAGVTSYAPFPADKFNPANSQYIDVPASGGITLSWQASDVDNDIVSYDVYFGTTATPPLYKSALPGSNIDNVPVKSKTRYFWKVVTRDSNNNTSTSDVASFNTN